MWDALSEERMGLSFTIATGSRQRSHSQVRVRRDSRPHFTVLDSRFPQPGVPCPHIYILQEQGAPVITPGTGFLFRRLQRLTGLRWSYSNPPGDKYFKTLQLYLYPMITYLTWAVRFDVLTAVSMISLFPWL
jgi:hypothetical protein